MTRPRSSRELLVALGRRATSQPDLVPNFNDMDVGAFLAMVEFHRVGPLVHGLLRADDRAPAPLIHGLAELSVRAHASSLRTQWVLRELDRVVDVPFLVIKGPVLSTWYPVGEVRDFGDLDVLVRPNHFEQAFESLEQLGCRCAATNWHGFVEQEVAEVPLTLGPTVVDLHWDLVARGRTRRDIRIGAERMFDHAIVDTVSGLEIRTPDPCDTLVHVAVHAGLEGGRRLREMIDLYQIVASGRVDPDGVARRAESYGAARLCAVTLQRCGRVLDTALTAAFVAELSAPRSWLFVNRVVDGIGLTLRERPPLAAGMLIAASRDTAHATALAVTRTLADDRKVGAGPWQREAPHDQLDWRRLPPDGDVGRHRRAYFEFVAGRSGTIRRVRCRDGDDVYRQVGWLQPRSSALLGAALSGGLRGQRVRIDFFESGDGSLAAVVVRIGWRPLGVTAYPLLIDPAAGPHVGRFLDASSVTDLSGYEIDTEPLRSQMSRWRHRRTAIPVSLPAGFIWEEAPRDVRPATGRDLPALVDAVWRYSPHAYPNRWLLRRRLRRALADGVFVAEADSPPTRAGFAIIESSTPDYDIWGQFVVVPEHRNEGLAWRLAAAAASRTSERGVGGMGMVVDSNPMPIPQDAASANVWTYVSLSPPRRFRGEARLRRWVDRILTLPERREQRDGNGGGDDAANTSLLRAGPRFTSRRTQEWWRSRQ